LTVSEDGVTIGLETHVQLDTNSKLFCPCPNRHADEPNTLTCPICLGHPGSRPAINEEALRQSVMVGEALGCDVSGKTRFARKTYFYPDMAKNFQVTQYDNPVAQNGQLKTEEQSVGIRRVHVEEDPASMVHEGGDISSAEYTLVDYNRAGRPLLEIVTEPDLSSPEEAREYLKELTGVLRYLGVYSPGSDFVLKSDANISLSGGSRVEVKNITGISEIEKALSYEISRQRQLRRRDREVGKQTRSFNSSMGSTKPLREKESEEDYGYIVEPDLTSHTVSAEDVERIKEDVPELPRQKRKRLKSEYGLGSETADSLVREQDFADLFEKAAGQDPEVAANLMVNTLRKVLNFHDIKITDSGVAAEDISLLTRLLAEDDITERNAEKALRLVVEDDVRARRAVEEQELRKTESSETHRVAESVVEDETEAVEDYTSGERDAINYLVGQVMSRTNGSADPSEAREMLEEILSES
jgi:aspartyl-tRNA(Asn)/glutamyl-tRNA(Gln) amidotransferase subunit B